MKKKYVLICISLISIFIVTLSTLFIMNIISIKLNGDKKVIVNVNEEYKDASATACINKLTKCVDTSNKIEITNNVNTKKVGTYKVKYKVKYGILSKTVTRTVNIVDNEAPVITLKGNKELNICPNAEYTEEGYEVKDNYDKKVKVDIKKEDNKLIYIAKDSSGNEGKEFRIINKVDEEKPVLTFEKTSYIKIGTSYQDNITAKDNCDGDITDKIKVSGNVDTNKEGSYILNYDIEDTSGNKESSSKTVYVYKENNPSGANNKIVYLTFDDGPGPYTNYLLDVLAKYNVKATFFVTAQYGYQNVLSRMYNEGHSIGAHSYSHNYNEIYSSGEAYFNDLNTISDIIYNNTGYRTNLLRFPGGSSNGVSRFNPGIMTYLTKEVENRGYQYFDWNIDSMDTSTTDPGTIAYNVTSHLGNGTYVVLQHDIKKGSVDAVEQIIQYGLTNGYTFLPLNVNSYKAHHTVHN